MSSYVVTAISSGNICGDFFAGSNIGLVAFTLAVMCVPVFDTVRVMAMRIIRRTSPFHPDKTHLHHLFIELGFSHVGTTASVLSLNIIVVLLWYIAYRCGASINTQFYTVITSGGNGGILQIYANSDCSQERHLPLCTAHWSQNSCCRQEGLVGIAEVGRF